MKIQNIALAGLVALDGRSTLFPPRRGTMCMPSAATTRREVCGLRSYIIIKVFTECTTACRHLAERLRT